MQLQAFFGESMREAPLSSPQAVGGESKPGLVAVRPPQHSEKREPSSAGVSGAPRGQGSSPQASQEKRLEDLEVALAAAGSKILEMQGQLTHQATPQPSTLNPKP